MRAQAHFGYLSLRVGKRGFVKRVYDGSWYFSFVAGGGFGKEGLRGVALTIEGVLVVRLESDGFKLENVFHRRLGFREAGDGALAEHVLEKCIRVVGLLPGLGLHTSGLVFRVLCVGAKGVGVGSKE
jgi:hypothetical protein